MADRPVVRSAATLTAIAALCAVLVASTYELTDERIAANDKAWLEQSLRPVLAGLEFDGSLIDSRATIASPHELPGTDDALVYRVYNNGSPVAALFVVTARDGYSGAIRLLIGIGTDGTITGVHALSHRETPGLGDRIDREKSDWIDQFAGRSIADPAAAGWRISRDGGEFDQLTGASVTSRAVVRAIRETLEYFASSGAEVYSLVPDAEEAAGQ